VRSYDVALAVMTTLGAILCEPITAQTVLPPPGPSVVGVASEGTCSGVQISQRFVLTSAHCVTPPKTKAILIGPSGAPISGNVTSKNPDNLLALICSLPTGSTPAPLGSVVPSANAAVEIESRSPGLDKWRVTSSVVSSTPSAIVISAIPAHKLPCNGDSGGPAYSGGTVVGIAETVPACGGPVTYTAVAPLGKWISGEMAKHDQDCTKWIRFNLPPPLKN
jgi:hypothetical protein